MSPSPPREGNILKRAFERWLLQRWFSHRPIAWLSPVAHLYGRVHAARRRRLSRQQRQRLPVPVIVVGNLIVGGAGKTPAVSALVEALRARAYRPGVLLRGYGSASKKATVLGPHSTVDQVGDEALLHYRALRVPVAVGRDRLQAGRLLLEKHPEINCLISDDGLQHYALPRDLELVVIDKERGFGNEALLPAGPLREALSRLEEVDAVLLHPDSIAHHAHRVPGVPRLEFVTTMLPPRPLEDWWSGDRSVHSDWSVWRSDTVHAVAGLAHPERFFKTLEKEGLRVIRHAFSDHHAFKMQELEFLEPYPVLMTEKDAVKCGAFPLDQHWVVPLKSALSDGAIDWLIRSLEAVHGR